MSFEVSLYTTEPPLKTADIIDATNGYLGE